MNKQQRYTIVKAFLDLDMNQDKISAAGKAGALAREGLENQLTDVRDVLQETVDEEQEKYDDLSEKAQEGSKGEALTEVISTLEEAVVQMENAMREVTDFQEGDDVEEWSERVINFIADSQSIAEGV